MTPPSTTLRAMPPIENIDAETVMRVHRATGLGILQARDHLAKISEHHRRQLLTAIEQQSGPPYHDPIEDDPAVAPLFAQARHEAESIVDREGERRLGSCHRVWHIIQRTLRERHRIEWLTPAQLNPLIAFD